MRVIATILFLLTCIAAKDYRSPWRKGSNGRWYKVMVTGYTATGTIYTIDGLTGDLIITPAITSPALQHGDSVRFTNYDLTSVCTQGVYGIGGDSIKFKFVNGFVSTDSYREAKWNQDSCLIVEGINFINVFGTPILINSRFHGVHFKNITAINAPGQENSEYFFYVADRHSEDTAHTNFPGHGKANTFYDISLTDSYFNGFFNIDFFEAGQSTYSSMVTDLKIANCTFKNMVTTSGTTGKWFVCNVQKMSVFDCLFDSTALAGGAHSAIFQIWGTINITRTISNHSYAEFLRINPMQWSGLPGYTETGGTAGNQVFNCIDMNTSYSMVEVALNDAGSRMSYNMDTANTWIYYNTVYRTIIKSYLGPYYGGMCDNFCGHCYVNNCRIISPEYDSTYNLAGRGYVMYFIAGYFLHYDSSHNHVFRYAANASCDSSSLIPQVSGARIGAAAASSFTPTPTVDFYGHTRPTPESADVTGAISANKVFINPRQDKRRNRLIKIK